MLFYIAPEVISLAQSDDSETIKLLNRLGHSRYNDFNIILAEREGLDILRNLESLDRSAKRSYHEAYIKLTSLFTLLDIIGLQIHVVHGTKEILNIEGKTIIKIPYTELNIGTHFFGTSILFENISEQRFYNHITDWYRNVNSLRSIESSYQPLNGGGNCISDVFLDIQKRGDRFCLAILDSDQKYPNSNFGDTAKRLIKIFVETGFCNFLVINTRECENLAPLNILQEICQGNVDWELGIDEIRMIHEVMPSAILYVDYKKGFKEKNIYDSANPDFINFYKTILQSTGLLTEEQYEIIRTREEESFKTNNRVIIHSIGHEVLDRIIENLDVKRTNNLTVSNHSPENLLQEWSRIGKQILDWTCSLPHFA